jgi:trans-aconitate methyltransferase
MTAAGYVTDVTYVPGFYPQMSPVAMRYVAALNGVIPPRMAEGFRFLELGCGLGRCLTTLAAAYPQGEFVGVDLNPEHTAAVYPEAADGSRRASARNPMMETFRPRASSLLLTGRSGGRRGSVDDIEGSPQDISAGGDTITNSSSE